MWSDKSPNLSLSGPSNKILRIRKRKTKGLSSAPVRHLTRITIPEDPKMMEMAEEVPIVIDMFTKSDPDDNIEKVRVGEDGSLNISLLRY